MSRFWSVNVYGLNMGEPHDPIIERETPGAAKYGAYKAAREAGYYSGRDGFGRFLADVSVRPATETEIALAPRIERRSHTPASGALKIEEADRDA